MEDPEITPAVPEEPTFDLPPIGEEATVDNSEARAALEALRKGEPLQGDEEQTE